VLAPKIRDIIAELTENVITDLAGVASSSESVHTFATMIPHLVPERTNPIPCKHLRRETDACVRTMCEESDQSSGQPQSSYVN
jgi:hypothetical protein